MSPQLRQQFERLGLRLAELDANLSDPQVLADIGRYRSLSREQAEVAQVMSRFAQYQQREHDLAAARSMLDDPEMAELARDEVAAAQADMQRLFAELQTGLLPRKRIDVAELVPQHALARILPTLRVGPLLFAGHDPRVPAPQLPGNAWTWLEGQTPATLTATPTAAVAPAQSELPEAAATVHEGWLRLDIEA